MRLNHPNDELGGMLLMCFPQEVVHELDAWSPLMPPPVWASASGVYHWHPPVMDHARVPMNGAVHGSYYDPDLYASYPGIARRSANEQPGSMFRRARSHRTRSPSQQPMTGALAVSHPQRMTRQTSYKGQVLKGGSTSKRNHSVGLHRHGKDSKARHDKTFNYIDMLRSLGQADDPPITPPRGLHKQATPGSGSSSSSVLQRSPPRRRVDDSETESSGGDDKCILSPPTLNGQYISGVQGSTDRGPSPFFNGIPSQVPESHPPPPPPPPLSGRSSHSPLRSAASTPLGEDKPERDVEREEREMVMRFIADRSIEIVVLVEGNDSTTGGVVQARHSYTGDDIQWNTSFVQCVLQDEDTGGAVIDFSLFHHTEATWARKVGVMAEEEVPGQTQQRMPFVNTGEQTVMPDRYRHDYQSIGTSDSVFRPGAKQQMSDDGYQLSSIV